jgi:hypothetical protein
MIDNGSFNPSTRLAEKTVKSILGSVEERIEVVFFSQIILMAYGE